MHALTLSKAQVQLYNTSLWTEGCRNNPVSTLWVGGSGPWEIVDLYSPHLEVAFRPCVSGDWHNKQSVNKKYFGKYRDFPLYVSVVIVSRGRLAFCTMCVPHVMLWAKTNGRKVAYFTREHWTLIVCVLRCFKLRCRTIKLYFRPDFVVRVKTAILVSVSQHIKRQQFSWNFLLWLLLYLSE